MIRLRNLYHEAASSVLDLMVYITDARCKNCTFSDDVRGGHRCDKHYQKQYMRERRSVNHLIKTF
jgi:hypothetical protein